MTDESFLLITQFVGSNTLLQSIAWNMDYVKFHLHCLNPLNFVLNHLIIKSV
jgi:hypothetical protein